MTVALNAAPAVAVAGVVRLKCVAAAAEVLIAPLVPTIELVTVSVAVTVRLPAVCRVTENVPVPAVRELLAGSTAAPSVLLNCTVPA